MCLSHSRYNGHTCHAVTSSCKEGQDEGSLFWAVACPAASGQCRRGISRPSAEGCDGGRLRIEASLSWLCPWICCRDDSPPFSLQNPPPPGRLLGLIIPAAGVITPPGQPRPWPTLPCASCPWLLWNLGISVESVLASRAGDPVSPLACTSSPPPAAPNLNPIPPGRKRPGLSALVTF